MILRKGRSSPGRSGSCPANMRKCLQETRGACCKVQLDLTEAANTRKRLQETRGEALLRCGPSVARNVTVHESRVTSVQKRMEPRRSLLGASVDVTDARRRVRNPDKPSRASGRLMKPLPLPELCLGTVR